MNDPSFLQSRFGAPGRFAKRIVARMLRFVLLRQAELEHRMHVVERWLPAIEGARVLAREANAGLGSLSARLAEIDQEVQVYRDIATRQQRIEEHLAEIGQEVQVYRDIATRQQRIEELQRGAAETINDLRDVTFKHDQGIQGAEQRLEQIVRRLDSLAFDIESLQSSLWATPYMSEGLDTWTPQERSVPGAFDYVGFEQLFRGPEELVRERQRVYVPLIADHAPVLDVGCGRGEFLELLAAANVEVAGIDLNPQMIAHCRAKGLTNAVHGDALAYLEKTAPGSLGAIFSAQVVEHLAPDDLLTFVSAARDRLRDGGRFVAETVNPNSIEGAKTFYVDLTHVKPLFPETLAFMCKSVGFASVRIFYPNGGGFDESAPALQTEYAVIATR